MMWNWLLTFLASKASIVLFDGFPMYKKDDLLLKIANDEKITTLKIVPAKDYFSTESNPTSSSCSILSTYVLLLDNSMLW